MIFSRIAPSRDARARAALRLATKETHERMHGLDPFVQIAAGTLSIDKYRTLLQALFVFHSVVGVAASRGGCSRFSSSKQRLNLLRLDLRYIGSDEPAISGHLEAKSREAVLGALYSAEGSMLGGRVIARQLDYAFGTGHAGRSFFIGEKENLAKWSSLLGELESACSSELKLNDAVRGAQLTFEWFEQCMTSSEYGNANGRREKSQLDDNKVPLHRRRSSSLERSWLARFSAA